MGNSDCSSINCDQVIKLYRSRIDCVSGQDSSTCTSVCTSPQGQSLSSTSSLPLPRRFHRPVSMARLCPTTRSLLNAARCTSFTPPRSLYTACTVILGFSVMYVTRLDDADVRITCLRCSNPICTSSHRSSIRPLTCLEVGVLVARVRLTTSVHTSPLTPQLLEKLSLFCKDKIFQGWVSELGITQVCECGHPDT